MLSNLKTKKIRIVTLYSRIIFWEWLQTWAAWLGIHNVGNFRIFSATQILREVNFGQFEAQKTAILNIWAFLDFGFLVILDILKCEIIKKQKSKSLKVLKWQFSPLWNAPKLISHKIWEKLLNFHTVLVENNFIWNVVCLQTSLLSGNWKAAISLSTKYFSSSSIWYSDITMGAAAALVLSDGLLTHSVEIAEIYSHII